MTDDPYITVLPVTVVNELFPIVNDPVRDTYNETASAGVSEPMVLDVVIRKLPVPPVIVFVLIRPIFPSIYILFTLLLPLLIVNKE